LRNYHTFLALLFSIFSWMGDCRQCGGRNFGHYRGISGNLVVREKTSGRVQHHKITDNELPDFLLQNYVHCAVRLKPLIANI